MRTNARQLVIRVTLFGQLAGLVTVAALLAIQYQSGQAKATEQVLPYSRGIAAALGERMRSAERQLQTLAAGAPPRGEDLQVFLQELQRVQRLGGFSYIVLASANGEVLFDSRDSVPGMALAASDAAAVPGLTVPIMRNSQVEYALHASLDPARMQPLLASVALPQGWTSAIADRQGKLIAQGAGAHPLVTSLDARAREALQQQDAGVFEATAADGVVLTAFAHAPAARWTSLVSAPRQELSAGAGRSAAWEMFAALLLLSAASWLSLRVSRRAVASLDARRQDAELQAALSDRKLQSVMGLTHEGVIVSDGQDRVVLANAAATRMFTSGRRSLVGKHVGTLLAPQTWVQYQTSQGDALAVAGHGRRTGAPPFPIEYSVSRFADTRGRLFRTLVIADVTARMRQEESLMEARGELRRVSREFESALIKEAENRQLAIARELHDAVGSSLAGLSLLLGTAYSFIREPEAAALISKSQEQVMKTTQQVRQISRGIMPVGQERGALLPALENFAANLSAVPGISCSVRSRGEFEHVSPQIGGHLFRIVQEATNNALRHGHALRVRITLVHAGKWCRLTVRDDGRGCEPAAVSGRNAGIGMKSMRARAEAIGGRFSVLTHPGRALKVQVTWLSEPA